MRVTRMNVGAAAACAWVALAGVLSAASVSANGPTITGAGSTWVQIALDQWRADIARQGYGINYQGVGSSAGRQFYVINQVDFAASEIPFQPDEVAQLRAEHKSYQYLPDVAGGTSLMYNLHNPDGSRITGLRLDAEAAARLFTGVITTWQDAKIKSLNPGLTIRETSVIPVIRSDGSGTSAQFSLYLANEAPATWNNFVKANNCPAPCSLWPPFGGSTQQKGSDGVANFVSNDAIGSGSIGYVEAGYAFGRSFPVASLHNVSGYYTQPTSQNVSTALAHATLNSDLTQNLTGVYRARDANAYPMSSYSYMITPTATGFGFDASKGAVLGTWIIYIACAGQREAAPLGYSPLPPNLVRADFAAVARIPGAPTPPPIDRVHCPNPTVTNAPSGSAAPRGSMAPPAASPTAAAARPSPSPTSGASPGVAAAGPGATPGAPVAMVDANGVRVQTVDDSERQALLLQAELAANDTQARLETPLIIAGAGVLLVVFGPILWSSLFRRRPRSQGPDAH